MRFRDYSVTQVLVGLYRIGLVGLHDALKAAEGSGLTERDELVDLILRELASKNYIPDPQDQDLRSAVWREYLRLRGEDFSAYYSKVEVIVRGEPGEERERFVDLVRSALAEMELEPEVVFEAGDKPAPQLAIRGEIVATGLQSQRRMHGLLRKTLSDW